MKARTRQKYVLLALIFTVGTVLTVALPRFTAMNDFVKQLLFVAPAALAGYVISSNENNSLLPKGYQAWMILILAIFLITLFLWAVGW